MNPSNLIKIFVRPLNWHWDSLSIGYYLI